MSDTTSTLSVVDPRLAQRPVERARAEGRVKLAGPGGLLGDLTRRVLEAGLEGEIDGHVVIRGTPSRVAMVGTRGTGRTKTVITDVGPVDIDVPRHRDGTFEPKGLRPD